MTRWYWIIWAPAPLGGAKIVSTYRRHNTDHHRIEHATSNLRCNDCGYALDALPADAACPECGRPAASSRLSARRGSAWQLSWNLLGAIAAPVRAPRGMWEDVRPERAVRSFVLLVVVCAIAAAPMGVSLWMGGPQTGRAHGGYALVFTGVAAVGLVVLSLTEACGLAFIGWRRGWERSVAHVLAVVGHASPGWVAGGVVCGLAWQVVERVPAAWTASPVVVQGSMVLPGGWPVGVALALAGGAGLLAFETLAYWGMRGLRYVGRG